MNCNRNCDRKNDALRDNAKELQALAVPSEVETWEGNSNDTKAKLGGIQSDEDVAEEAYDGCFSKACFILRYIIWRRFMTLIPLLLTVAYLVYVDPQGAIFVCLVAPLVLFLTLNKLLNHTLSKKINYVRKRITNCCKLKRRISLWIRR